MRQWLLLVHDDEDVLELAAGAFRGAQALVDPAEPGDALQQHRAIFRARNLSEAQENLENLDKSGDHTCDLIVLGAATPVNRMASVAASTREPTIEFIKRVKNEFPKVPIVVLSSQPDAELNGFLKAFDQIAWVDFKPSTPWLEQLMERASDLMAGRVRLAGVLDLDINLSLDHGVAWRLERRGSNPFEESGLLSTDAGVLKKIIEKSRRLEGEITTPNWMSTLSELSSEMGSLLFKNAEAQQTFWETFAEQLGREGIEKSRIRFTVNEATDSAFVEALKYGKSRNYWMLRAPMFRRYANSIPTTPLFKDGASRAGPITCLVIEADPSGGTIGNRSFSMLPQITQETESIAATLERNPALHGIGKVNRVRLSEVSGNKDAVIAALYKELTKHQWNLVHFAGHVASLSRASLSGASSLNGGVEDEKVAALVLSANRGCALDVANFVNKLDGTQFLFMSSCRSADSYVVAHAAKEHIPAVLGFRWTVGDKSAAAFADAFYRRLFSRGGGSYKFLEYAFRDARKFTYQKDVNDPTWASPVLMMQMRELAQIA